MGFLKLLLNIGLILAIRTIPCIGKNLKIKRLSKENAIPFHYNISLTSYLEEGNFTFYGESNVNIEIRYASTKIYLHSRELEINEMATTLINDNGMIYKPMKHIHNNVTDILTLNFNDILWPDLYTLNMEFVGRLSEPSEKLWFYEFSYTTLEGKNIWIAVTHFSPNNARRMFPCWDEPALKATFNISVLHHEKYTVLSNMPIQDTYYEQEDMIKTYFEITPIMSTYVVAIAMFHQYISFASAVHETNINTFWCRNDSSSLTSYLGFAYNTSEKITEILIQYTNNSLKIPKIDHVVIPKYIVDSMGNWGLITHKESDLIYDTSRDPTYKKVSVTMLITRKLVLQWFGNLVTPSWWPYLWLSEGIASFIQKIIIEKIFELEVMYLLDIEDIQRCLLQDTDSLNSVTLKASFDDTLDELSSQYSTELYKKSPVLLRMLHNTITAEIFRKGLITYLIKYQFSTATPNNLWSTMQSALDESDIPHENYTIKEMMDTWMNQERYPFVHVERNYETGEVTISQTCVRQYSETENKTTKWWIPITFATQSNPDFSNTVPRYWLRPDQHNISFIINSDDWIIVNLQLSGYYRVNYDIKNWEKIAYYLNTNEYGNIHVLNRAQIIADSHAMVVDDRIGGYLYLQLISYLKRDRNSVAWQPLLDIIQTMPKPLLLPEMKHVKKRYKQLLHKFLQHIKYVENHNDDDVTKMTRLTALKCACDLGNKKCKKLTALKLSKHLANPNTYKILRGEKFMYCTGMMAANKTTWDKMFELYVEGKLKEEPKRLLMGLSCAEKPNIIINYLNVLAYNTSLFEDNDHSRVFKYILKRHARKDKILKYILNNFEAIKPKSLSTPAVIKLILDNVYFFKQIAKVEKFSQTNYKQYPNILFEIKKLIDYSKEYLWKVIHDVKRKFDFKKFHFHENLFSRYSPREKSYYDIIKK